MIHVETFLIHLNSQHPRIKFTTELQKNNRISFLDNLVHVLANRSTKITIYRKATHTDQYLDWNSNHHVKQKMGLISTFEHRIEELVTEEEDKKKELRHVRKALRRCGHPNWTMNRRRSNRDKTEQDESRGKVVLPYVKGVSERLTRIFRKYNIRTIHKPSAKLKNILCNKMKDKVELLDKTGTVYYNQCHRHKEPKKNDYVGETDRVLRKRLYEHNVIDHKTSERAASLSYPEEKTTKEPQGRRSTRLKAKKQKDYKAMQTGSNQPLTEGSTEFSAHVAGDLHEKGDLSYEVLCTEEKWFARGVKEAIAIRKIRPSLNQDEGRYHLSAIYNKFIRTSLPLMKSRQGTEEATEEN